MDKNVVVIKGSFRGILGEFVKDLAILLCTYIIYIISRNTLKTYYTKYSIDSFFNFAIKFEEPKVIAILSFIFLLFIILAVIGVSTLWKAITLLYETQRTVTLDFISGKIMVETRSFPFNKTVDEHKFNEVITVSVNQGLLHRLFNTGEMYIEYLTCSKVDSQIRAVEIPYVTTPANVKPNLI